MFFLHCYLSLPFKMVRMNADAVVKLLMETDNDNHDYYIDLCSPNCRQIICCIIWHASIFCLQSDSGIFYTRILLPAESGTPSTTRVLVVGSQRVKIVILIKIEVYTSTLCRVSCSMNSLVIMMVQVLATSRVSKISKKI